MNSKEYHSILAVAGLTLGLTISAPPAFAQHNHDHHGHSHEPAPATASASATGGQQSLREELDALKREVRQLKSRVSLQNQQLANEGIQPVGHDGHDHAAHRHHLDPKALYEPGKSGHDHHGVKLNAAAAVDVIGSYSANADNWNLIVRDVEIMVSADIANAVRGVIVGNAHGHLDPIERSELFEDINFGVEEAFIETISLPYGLKVKAGQYFADFTRLGQRHPHDRPFTDGPPSLVALIGDETKARGIEVNWTEEWDRALFSLTVGAADFVGSEPSLGRTFHSHEEEHGHDHGHGSVIYAANDNRTLGDVSYYMRAAGDFEVTKDFFFSVGANYLVSAADDRRQVFSGDAVAKWYTGKGKDGFTLGGAGYWTRDEGEFDDHALEAEGFADGSLTNGAAEGYGGYVYASYRSGMFEPGVRYDYFSAETWDAEVDEITSLATVEGFEIEQSTYSVFLNVYPHENHRLRFTANYVDSNQVLVEKSGDKDDVQVFFQWTVILGDHGHDH